MLIIFFKVLPLYLKFLIQLLTFTSTLNRGRNQDKRIYSTNFIINSKKHSKNKYNYTD
jgi:hypothetical protein